jgi:hypothetical protein
MSYTWSSIQRASWILKKGGLWTVGNGASINIWEDNWLPEQEGYKVWSQKKEGVTQNMVQDLIIPLSKSWNRGIITKLFYPIEAQQVLNIPITDINYQDELCWPKTTDGTYTVKSGYHAIKEWDNKTGDPSTSGSNNDNPCWGKNWMQNIPPKHNHLVWRILNNALPVRDNLNKRGIHCYPLCPRCNSKIEDINHVFKECIWAQQIWFASPLNIRFVEESAQSFIDWLQYMFTQTKPETTEQISTICYHIWKARNALISMIRSTYLWKMLFNKLLMRF